MIQGLLQMQQSGIRPSLTEEFLDEEGNWQCTSCGACCKDVSWCLPTWTVDGKRCKHLLDNNLCSIYEIRPDICCMDKWQNPPAEIIARNCAYMKELHEPASDPE